LIVKLPEVFTKGAVAVTDAAEPAGPVAPTLPATEKVQAVKVPEPPVWSTLPIVTVRLLMLVI
jgi:hypothetical protein